MSELSLKQRKFLPLVSELIRYAYSEGYELTLGDGYRDPRVFGNVGESRGYGHRKSAHKQRLAIDLNLFKNGAYLDQTFHHKFLGDYWKSLDPDCRWGGDFEDGNHYSLEFQGVM